MFFNSSLVENYKEILNLLLSDEVSVAVANSISVVKANIKELLLKILRDPDFLTLACEILSGDDVGQDRVGRLATLACSLFCTLPKETRECCVLISHFLRYCSNATVFSFLSSILSSGISTASVQKWLLEFGFILHIKREFEFLDYDHKAVESAFTDPLFVKVSCLYKLLSIASSNSIFYRSLLDEELIKYILKEFKHMPPFLISDQWDLIIKLISPVSYSLLSSLIERTVRLLKIPTTKLYSYHVSCIDYYTLLINIELNFAVHITTDLLDTIIDLLKRFPGSSILHTSFFKFITCLLSKRDISTPVINIFTPLMFENAKSENRILKFLGVKYLEVLYEKYSKENKAFDNPDIESYYIQNIKPYLNIMKENYGGTCFFYKFKAIFSKIA